MSKVLDFFVGDSDSVFLGRREIQEAIRINAEAEAGGGDTATLNEEEVKIIQGAMNFRDKHVRDKFVPIEKVFMISDRALLGPELFADIKEIGHSRIPVYHNTRDLVVGILIVFDILDLDPLERKPVDELELLEVPRVSADLPLHRILSNFKTGGHQMAIVLDPTNKITPIGIITLEDVLEVLIDSDIKDEKESHRKKKLESGTMKSSELSRSLPSTKVSVLSETSEEELQSDSHEKVKDLLHQPGPFLLRHGTLGEFAIARSPAAHSPRLLPANTPSKLADFRASKKSSESIHKGLTPLLSTGQTLIDVNDLVVSRPANRFKDASPDDGPRSDDEQLLFK
jgi:Mg2+/Co2+ transporter CorC